MQSHPKPNQGQSIRLSLLRPLALQLRREAANAPAREAAAAVRQAATGPDATPEGVAAARAALHEAAAAAADACGQCERYHGENEELDAAWIACDTCQRCALCGVPVRSVLAPWMWLPVRQLAQSEPALPRPPPTPHRWFHCACGRAGQDDVEAMGSVDSWSCQTCKMFRRQMERAVARSQR